MTAEVSLVHEQKAPERIVRTSEGISNVVLAALTQYRVCRSFEYNASPDEEKRAFAAATVKENVQPANAKSPTDVTDDGMVNVFIDEQSQKARTPI